MASEADLRREVAELRERLEETTRKLQETEEELRAVHGAVVDGLIIVDATTGECLYANEQMAHMLGYTLESLPKNAADVHRPEDMPEIARRFQAQVEGNLPLADNVPFLHKNGTDVYTDISGSLMVYKGRRCLVSFVRDVTERHEAEKALRHSEAIYRGLVEASPDAVVMTDLEGRILLTSQRTSSSLGQSPDAELVGRSVFDFVVEQVELAANVRDVIENGIRRNSHYTVIRADNTAMPVEASSSVVRGPDGQPTALMAIIRDVSDRKKAEEELERERKTLWHMLRSSDHERQLIAYDIHDGLAQQLAAAAMQFQTYQHLQTHDPATAKTAFDAGLQMVRQAHSEARRLISGVRPPILDESGIVAALAHLVHDPQQPDGPSIEFQSDVEFRRLEPVLENAAYRIAQEALANACQHSQSPRVRLALIQADETIRIEVQDWGVGFDPDSVSENRFGLQGIRERARLLDGTVAVDTEPNKGTSIVVTLPLILQPADQ